MEEIGSDMVKKTKKDRLAVLSDLQTWMTRSSCLVFLNLSTQLVWHSKKESHSFWMTGEQLTLLLVQYMIPQHQIQETRLEV